VLVTGCRWQDLPHEYGAPTTGWRRLKRWREDGVWERIWRAALVALDLRGKLDWTMTFLDGSFASAKKRGDKVGLTKKGSPGLWASDLSDSLPKTEGVVPSLVRSRRMERQRRCALAD
jgi:transposase